MLEQYILTGVAVYFFGLILSAFLAYTNISFKRSAQFFIFSNAVGFLSVLGYFLNSDGSNLTLAHFNWFFQFAPRLNFLVAIFFLLVSGVSVLVGVYSLRYLELYKNEYDPRLVQCLMSFFVLGMQGVLIANNTFAFLFFWEVMSVASFFLVMADKKPESIQAAFLYFIMTHLGASAILGGFLILGHGSFIFNLSDIHRASAQLSPAMTIFAFSLFVFGFGSKAGLVPFHVWLPEAHPQAPSNISAMMSGLMLKIAVYGFLMIILTFSHIPAGAGLVVLFLGLLSGLVGALYSVVERGVKKTFAYSSIENMGIIFAMLGLAIYLLALGNLSMIAYAIIAFAIFHAMNHALFKTALFLSSGVVINRMHTKRLEMMGGLARVMPIFSFAFLLAILGSLPLPGLGTFYGEWGLIQNIIVLMSEKSVGAGTVLMLVVVLAVVSMISGLAIFAMIKVFAISMLGLPRQVKMEKRNEKSDYLMTGPILILGAGVVALGFSAKFIIPNMIGNIRLSSLPTVTPAVYASPLALSSTAVSGTILIFGLAIYLLQKFLLTNKKERLGRTWDCGQAIDATMQYSATAFSAPIRFFFLTFIGRKKIMRSVAVVDTNPWIRKYDFNLTIRPNWSDVLYAPIAKGLLMTAKKIRHIQNGRIQYYILFLFLALTITLIFAL